MGKKGLKVYTKVCTKYNTLFEGFAVPKGAIYGRILVPYIDIDGVTNDYVFFVCDKPKTLKTRMLSVHIMKREWNNNATCAVKRITWHDAKVGVNHPIYIAVREKCTEIGGYPKVTTFTDPRKEAVKVAEMYSQVAHSACKVRKAQEPQARCYKQSMVDGKGYSIDWEAEIQAMPEEGYNGLPVQYPNGKKAASFTSFEGVTDTEQAMRRDGMKVNQTKIRPEKEKNTKKIVIKINGITIDC